MNRFLITGHRMTGSFNFLPRGLSDSLHRIYLNVPLIVLFIALIFAEVSSRHEKS